MSRYFKNYEDKYNPFLSLKKPIVIKAKVNIDKKEVKINSGYIKNINFIMKKVTRDLSRKYNCIAFSSFNEINLIMTDTNKIITDKNKLESQYIVSLFAQEIFTKYNQFNNSNNNSFVSVNAFNIYEDKVKSYLYDRQSTGFNDYVSFLSSKLFSYSQIKNRKRTELLEIIENISPSLKLIKQNIKNGFTVFNGYELEINDIDNITDANNITNKKSTPNKSELIYEFIEEDI